MILLALGLPIIALGLALGAWNEYQRRKEKARMEAHGGKDLPKFSEDKDEKIYPIPSTISFTEDNIYPADRADGVPVREVLEVLSHTIIDLDGFDLPASEKVGERVMLDEEKNDGDGEGGRRRQKAVVVPNPHR